MNFASLCSLAGLYDNLISTRFLAPVDCLKIPAQVAGPFFSKGGVVGETSCLSHEAVDGDAVAALGGPGGPQLPSLIFLPLTRP